MSDFDYITPFYEKNHNRHSIIKELDSLLSSEYLTVRAIPFSSNIPPVELLSGTIKGSRETVLKKSNEGIHLFRLFYSFKEDRENKKESGLFFVLEHEEYKKVYIALTIESGNFYSRALLPFIKSLYPKVLMTFITHKRLKRLLTNFKEKNQFREFIITRASQRFRFEEAGKHEKIVPMITWPDMELEEAFEWVHQNNGWFQSLEFKVKKIFDDSADICFTRQGIVRTNQFFSKVFESFTLPVCKILDENIKIFRNRSRRIRTDLSVRPLTIDFETEQFLDVTENDKFIQAMKHFRKASVSVIHGNPYLHMSVIDYFDGSTFDLWVLNPRHLVVVPQMEGSIPAIKRLINHIFDTYAEGKIKDFKEVVNE